MPEHVHVHAPHELAEPIRRPCRGASAGSRWSRCCCCRWRRSASRGAATRPRSGAGSRPAATRRRAPRAASPTSRRRSPAQERTQDLLNFNRWLEVTTDGQHPARATCTSGGSAPSSARRSTAWLAEDPLNNVDAVAEPAARSRSTSSPTSRRPIALEHVGDVRFEQGKEATEHADDYVFVHRVLRHRAVLRRHLAAVQVVPACGCSILGIAAAFLVYGVGKLATMPTL